jgi:hypothetical protein
LAILKTKQFCKTFSLFAIENIKKRSNSARLPSKMQHAGFLPWLQPSIARTAPPQIISDPGKSFYNAEEGKQHGPHLVAVRPATESIEPLHTWKSSALNYSLTP